MSLCVKVGNKFSTILDQIVKIYHMAANFECHTPDCAVPPMYMHMHMHDHFWPQK